MWQDKYRLITFDEIDSTNKEALRLAKEDIAQNLVIFTQCQTGGYGRYGRTWESGEGNLAMSILLKADDVADIQSQLSFVAGLSVYSAIRQTILAKNIAVEMLLKWPNDVLINGNKIAGILLQSIKYNDKQYLTIGIGANVNYTPRVENKKVTSLQELDLNISARDLLDLIMHYFIYYDDLWRKEGFVEIRDLWLEKTFKAGEVISFSDGVVRIIGQFMDVDSEGAIRIRMQSGEIYRQTSGEVFLGEDSV